MPHIESENDFLSLIDAAFPRTHPALVLGRGDDCAELACPSRMAVSTDLFVEDIHFRARYFSPEDIGYKALAVNISDLAAAGAVPLGFSAGLIAPAPFSRKSAQGILAGMAMLAAKYDLALTGGDLSRGDKLAFCLTVWGAPAPSSENSERSPFLRRGPVRPGDALFVCGANHSGPSSLGLARVGLALLEQHGREAMADHPAACAAHLRPLPLVKAGLALAKVPGCRVMDVSDGLARDLPRLLRAYGMRCGAEVSLPPDLLHSELLAFARKTGDDPAALAFAGGEDYALLGACPPEQMPTLRVALNGVASLLLLGRVTDRSGIRLNGVSLADEGFDHFA